MRRSEMKFNEVHLQKDKRNCSTFLNSSWKKDMVGGKD